jgi:hypothetical protein
MDSRQVRVASATHRKLYILAQVSDQTMQEILDALVSALFAGKFGDVDPDTVRIERRAVVVGEGE